MLFDKVFAEYRNYFIPGTAIAVRCKYEMNSYSNRVVLRVSNIAFLKDLKGKMVQSIVISLNENQLQFGSLMHEQLKAKSDTKCDLVFKIHDLETNRYVEMKSKFKIPLTREFIEQLDELEIKYKVEV